MPLPAGTGLSRRSFVTHSVGAVLAVYGALAARALARSRRGSRRPPPGRHSPCSSASSSRAAPTRCRCSRRRATRSTASFAPKLGAHRRHRARRGQPALLASGRGRARTALRRAEGQRDAGDRLHERRPEPLHVAPLLGGRRDEHEPSHRLARALSRRRRDDGQPAPGPVARRHARAGARDGEGAGRVDRRRPTSTTSGATASGARSRRGC